MSQIRDWAEKARSKLNEKEGTDTINSLEQLLTASESPEITAKRICTIWEPSVLEGDEPDVMWSLFCFTITAFGPDEATLGKLGDLLICISQRELLNSNGDIVKHLWGSKYWNDLPGFYQHFDDELNNLERSDNDMADWPWSMDDQLNGTIFAALLLTRPFTLGMETVAETVITFGLEVSTDGLRQLEQREVFLQRRRALIWLTVAANKIYELSQADAKHEALEPPERSLATGHTWVWGRSRGFSLARWGYWKKALLQICSDLENNEPDIREMAQEASNGMTGAEAI